MWETGLTPMEPVAADTPFDSPAHLFEVKWDGVRMLAFCEPAGVRLQNRRLHDRTLQYPELQALRGMIHSNAVLDGEVVAFREGRPSFFAVMQRDSCRTEERVRQRAKAIPVAYMVFDVILWGDKTLLGTPLVERKALLAGLMRESAEHIYIVENHGSSGTALFEATKQQRLEGIVGKELSSPYVPGGKSSYWTKVKHRMRQLCTLCGYAPGAGGFLSLIAGCWSPSGYIYVGRVSSGLVSSVSEQLSAVLPGITVESSPLSNPPAMKSVRWVKPQLTFVAEFFEWTEDMKMRAPVFIGFSGEPPEASILE